MSILSLEQVKLIAALAKKAGEAILEIYGSDDFGVSFKDDRSPLTKADKRSHNIIMEGLASITPGIPVLSEEGRDIPYETRKSWSAFYLVDPLDGTKEFINRNGEFTVNIALLENGVPTAGVIYVPVKGVTYYALNGHGAFLETPEGTARISMAQWPQDGPIAVASRSHGSPETEAFLDSVKASQRISAGSSLKLCLVAEGKAHVYPRFGPTWEWDTAAGHAISLEAGGRVVETDGTTELSYNKEVLKHKGFICSIKSVFPLHV